MATYCVYKYTSPSNKVYIGQTCNSLSVRAKNGEGYKDSPKFYNAIKKYGFKNFQVEILKNNLTLEEANYWEEYYIQLYQSRKDSNGYNIAYGGSNYTVTEETKEKMSLSHIGKHHSEETKKKISDAEKGKIITKETKEKMKYASIGKHTGSLNGMYGKAHSESTKQKIGQKIGKPVMCIETGIVYFSANEACRQLGIKTNHINDCITNPTKYKTCGGYHWRRIEED